jgi:hypothetical protein
MDRFELRNGKFGPYFHDTKGSGYDMPLTDVLIHLNQKEEYKQRLIKANEGRQIDERF